MFDDYAVLETQNIIYRNVVTQDFNLNHLERLAGTLLDLFEQGVNVVPILAYQSNGDNGYIIQPRAKGAELYDRNRLNNKDYVLHHVELISNAPQEHFDKFVADTIKIVEAGVLIDFVGKDNFFYHETIGFQFIDLNAHYDYVYGITDIRPQAQQIAAWNCFIPCYYDTVPTHRDTVSGILSELTDSERKLLDQNNRCIFEKCKAAMSNNGIADDILYEVILSVRFIPQKLQLALLG